MQSRQLYAAVTSSSQIYFDMPSNSRIRGVVFTAYASTLSGATDYLELEVSTASTNQTAVNDAQNIVAIATFAGHGSGTPATIAQSPFTTYVPADAPIKAGERVYLTYTESGGGTWRVRALVWFD